MRDSHVTVDATAYLRIARNATRLFEEWRLLTCPLARFEPLHGSAPSTVWSFSETALKISVQCPISTPDLAIFTFEVLIDGRLSMSACEILADELAEPIDRLSDLKIVPAIRVLCESVVAQLIKDRLDAEL